MCIFQNNFKRSSLIFTSIGGYIWVYSCVVIPNSIVSHKFVQSFQSCTSHNIYWHFLFFVARHLALDNIAGLIVWWKCSFNNVAPYNHIRFHGLFQKWKCSIVALWYQNLSHYGLKFVSFFTKSSSHYQNHLKSMIIRGENILVFEFDLLNFNQFDSEAFLLKF